MRARRWQRVKDAHTLSTTLNPRDANGRLSPLITASSSGVCSASPLLSLHHLHMQRRRGQIHRGQAHIPCRDARLVVRPDTLSLLSRIPLPLKASGRRCVAQPFTMRESARSRRMN